MCLLCVGGRVGGGHEGSGSGGAADLEQQECPAGWKKRLFFQPGQAGRCVRSGEARRRKESERGATGGERVRMPKKKSVLQQQQLTVDVPSSPGYACHA